MGKCVPGMPCYGGGNDVRIYYTYPKGCTTSQESPYAFPFSSNNLFYAGPNLPYTGIQTEDTLTVALQKIDTYVQHDAIWGDIGGTLTDQTDLITYLSDNYAEKNIAVIDISSSQILALHNTPVELIPAPGIGKVISITSMRYIYKHGGVTYGTSGGSPTVGPYYDSTTSLSGSSFNTTTLLVAAVSTINFMNFTTLQQFAFTLVENKNVTLKTQSASTSYINGNGTLRVVIVYSIDDIQS